MASSTTPLKTTTPLLSVILKLISEAKPPASQDALIKSPSFTANVSELNPPCALVIPKGPYVIPPTSKVISCPFQPFHWKR